VIPFLLSLILRKEGEQEKIKYIQACGTWFHRSINVTLGLEERAKKEEADPMGCADAIIYWFR
jgi:hypothetical protein